MAEAMTIGIYSPGAMGGALGRAWQAAGARVVTTVAGRSARTAELAHGLELLPSLGDLCAASNLVVSIGPPASSVPMASDIAAACRARDVHPVVADLNAIAPTTIGQIATALADSGCRLLDGSISGGPPHPGATTHLYLSGPDAHLLADLDALGVVPRIVGDAPGTASAVKMCTASMYKGFSGLLTQALQTAHANDVTDIVLADLREGFGDMVADPATTIAMAASKSDRFPGEMREIAAAQQAAGAEAALFLAMAAVFESVARTELGSHSPEAARELSDLDVVLEQLRRSAADG